MKQKILLLTIIGLSLQVRAQDLEFLNGKNIKQPGELNPAMAGIQEDFIRLLTDLKLGTSYQFLVEGHLPFKLGNYMVGYEYLTNNNVSSNMFNFTYARVSQKEKKYTFRYGASLQMNQRQLFKTDFDSSKGYTFVDLNGELRTVPSLTDLRNDLDFVNLEIGASLNYKNLIASLGIENVIKQNVSFVKDSTRNLPFAGNLYVGGFLNFGENTILFPSVLASYYGAQTYLESSLELSTKYFNLGSSYITYTGYSAFSASIAVSLEKTYVGLEYTHPIEGGIGLDQYPRFNVVFNTGLFKRRNIGKSDFAERIRNFY